MNFTKTTLLVGIIFSFSVPLYSQLYSSGNNNISGNFIGIGEADPEGSIHIKESMYQDYTIGGGGTGQWFGSPMIRLQSSNSTGSPVSKFYWDLLTDGSSTLKWKYTLDSGSSSVKMSFSPNLMKLYTDKFQLNEGYQIGEATTPDGTLGSYLSLGMLHQSGNLWSGKGLTIFTSAYGNVHFVSNKNTTINGLQDLNENTSFIIKGNNEFYVKSELLNVESELNVGTDLQVGSMLKVGTVIQVGDEELPSGAVASFSGGDVYSEKYICKSSGNWPDYVFEEGYKLRTIEEVEEYINTHNHLPELPSAEQIDEEGVDLEEMNKLLLKKVEELTLYIIDMKQELNALKSK